MLVVFLACLGKKGIDSSYHVDAPSSHWVELPPNSADRAWRNAKQESLIYVKSNCGQYFEDRLLKDSLLSLTRGLPIKNTVLLEELRIANRKALLQIVDSEIDGVNFRLAMVVVSKNNCLYDFLYIAPPQYFPEGIAHFMNTAQSLQTNLTK